MQRILIVIVGGMVGTFIRLGASSTAYAAFANYNSVLVGEQAAGMGGAYTALFDDPSAVSFYNPAAIARMEGNSFSATANVYAKYDSQFGSESNLDSAALRVNQGSFIPIPSSSGLLYSFRNFATGISIISPDYETFAGAVSTDTSTTSTINYRDQSLWVGGSLALNFTENTSGGVTFYYTSRTFNRTVIDRVDNGGNVDLTSEETFFTNNSLVTIFGYFHRLSPNWNLGLSYRAPSVEISGKGSYYRTVVLSGGGSPPLINLSSVSSDSNIPDRANFGLSYKGFSDLVLSCDLSYHGVAHYRALKGVSGSELIRHQPTFNVSVGANYNVTRYLDFRVGAYTNNSSHETPAAEPTGRRGDSIDMWGFSTNVAIRTQDNSRVTLGGYYTGGKGETVQEVGGNYVRLAKSLQVFNFLVGTSFSY